MKRIFVLIILVSILIPKSDADAYDFAAGTKDGNNWLGMCGKYGTDELLDSMCDLYTGGIIEGWMFGYSRGRRDMSAGKPLDNPNAMFYCKTKDQTTKQHVLIIKKYIEEHPKFLHIPAVFLIIDALSEAFPYPCNNNPNFIR